MEENKQILKTSEEWQKLDTSGITIMDPDGWDRANYEYSFYQEKITEADYKLRKMYSTCIGDFTKKQKD